ncbi:MAG: Bug family tripartite tricarboxylate transporter substrate binding protein [Burkholderiaceae bacterium]
MIAVLGGEVDALFTAPDAPMPHLRSGKLRALATMGYKRHRVLPEVPTVVESLPDIEEVTVWFGIVARAGVPAAVQQRLGAEAGRALAAPDVGERLAALGQDSNFAGPEEFARIIASDIALWGPLIKSVGIRVE